MIIKNSTKNDIDEIFRLYKIATEFQKSKSIVPWPQFKKNLIITEINEKRQWQININNEVACIWAIVFDDPLIWGEKNKDPSVYIHRIATNPKYRGQSLVAEIVKWATIFANENSKKFIRLDTVGENLALIEYYKKCGFKFIGLSKLNNTEGLPEHYSNALVSLFEIKLKD